MSKYTIELRKICDLYGKNEVESWFKSYDLNDYLTTEQQAVITNANMWTKDKLASKIVNRFYFREIAFETPNMFKHFAMVKMEDIMDKYLPLIYSNSLNYSPLEDIRTEHTENRIANNTTSGNGASVSTSTTSNTSSGLVVNSNTPQGQITKANILNGTYASATSANENETSGSISDRTETSSSGTNNISETIVKNESGNRTSKADLLLKYRKTIINIDDMIMKDLNDLFFGLW